MIQQCLEKIRAGKGEAADLDYLKELAETVKRTSRCGLGQTSPNPVLSTLEHFRSLYEARLTSGDSELRSDFDLERSVRQAAALAGRESSHVQH